MNFLFYSLLFLCAKQAKSYFNQRTIAGIVGAQPRIYSVLTHVLVDIGMYEFLDCPEYCTRYTLFLPNDHAFAVFPHPHWLEDKQYRGHLKELILYHMLTGRVYYQDLKDGGTFDTLLQGQSLVSSLSAFNLVTINNDTTVTRFDKWARNGLMQRIDRVLLPACAQETVLDVISRTSNMFYAALVEAGLHDMFVDTNRSFTVLVPVDASFGDDNNIFNDRDWMEKLVINHVVPDMVLTKEELQHNLEYSTLAGTKITIDIDDYAATSLLGSNGVVHFIKRILVPTMNLVETAASKGLYSFLHALEISNLTSMLEKQGPFTVFSWTESAWNVFPEAETLLFDYGRLGDLIKYHIVPDDLQIQNSTAVKVNTLLNLELEVRIGFLDAGHALNVLVNGIRTSGSNFIASNGRLYVLSQVLEYPGE